MKKRDHRSLLVTGLFVLVLLVFLSAGLAPALTAPEPAAAPASDRDGPDAQFALYVEYRARLENAADCQ